MRELLATSVILGMCAGRWGRNGSSQRRIITTNFGVGEIGRLTSCGSPAGDPQIPSADKGIWREKKSYLYAASGLRTRIFGQEIIRNGARMWRHRIDSFYTQIGLRSVPKSAARMRKSFEIIKTDSIAGQLSFDIHPNKKIISYYIDIRDYKRVSSKISEINPQIVFHLAAQSLVSESYANSRKTHETNILGTVNILESLKSYRKCKSVIIVTTDKVYKKSNK